MWEVVVWVEFVSLREWFSAQRARGRYPLSSTVAPRAPGASMGRSAARPQEREGAIGASKGSPTRPRGKSSYYLFFYLLVYVRSIFYFFFTISTVSLFVSLPFPKNTDLVTDVEFLDTVLDIRYFVLILHFKWDACVYYRGIPCYSTIFICWFVWIKVATVTCSNEIYTWLKCWPSTESVNKSCYRYRFRTMSCTVHVPYR